MLENLWNRSIRVMFDLPLQTHTIYIEPISERSHVKNILVKRFLTFVQALKSSPKLILTNLLKMISKDVQSVTGSNLRQILLLVNKSDVDDLVPEDSSKIQYRPEDEENTWKIRMVKELIEVRNGTLQVDNFNKDEINEVLDSLCVD